MLFASVWPLLIIFGIGAWLLHRRDRSSDPAKKVSHDRILSQLFVLSSIFFFGAFMYGLNRDLDFILSWRSILLVFALFALFVAYYFSFTYSLVVGLVATVAWWVSMYTEWALVKGIRGTALLLAVALILVLFYLLSKVHEKLPRWKEFTDVFSSLSIITFTSILFLLSTQFGLVLLEEASTGLLFFASWQVTLSLFTLLALVIGLIVYSVSELQLPFSEVLILIFISMIFLGISLVPEQQLFAEKVVRYSSSLNLNNFGVMWALFFNIIVFADLVGIIYLGYKYRKSWLINLGALFLFLFIMVKYADWFFSFLDKSIFFIGAGVLLLVVGWFMEKARRIALASLEASPEGTV